MTKPDIRPRVLFIDAYDSFSNNIISLLETELNVSVRTVKIDNPALSSDAALYEELRHYAAVVCGPGPGHPGKEEDVGIIGRVWKLDVEQMLPVLGICLGFQSLCLEFGGEVKRLKGPQHGMIRRVRHIGEHGRDGKDTVFEGVGNLTATHYQSLCVDIGQDSIAPDVWEKYMWTPTRKCPDLVPLAWVESCGADENSGVMDDRVLVAVQHRAKPFCALQYHPESICTNDESKLVIRNWFRQAQSWNLTYRETPYDQKVPIHGKLPVRDSLTHQYNATCLPPHLSPGEIEAERFITDLELDNVYRVSTTQLRDAVSVPDIVEALQDSRRDHIILESSNIHEKSTGPADARGRYSIIGLDIDCGLRFEYKAPSNFIKAIHPDQGLDKEYMIDLRGLGVWPFLASFLDKRRISSDDEEMLSRSPFLGGFMGYTTYEMGLEGIEVASKPRGTNHSRPDLCFAWVTRSLVIDHVENVIHMQALVKKGSEHPTWMDAVALKLKQLSLPNISAISSNPTSEKKVASASSSQTSILSDFSESHGSVSMSSSDSIDLSNATKVPDLGISTSLPHNDEYETKVRRCQEYIRSGDSYELCLTDQTTVQRQRFDSPHKPSLVHTLEDIVLHRQRTVPSHPSSAWNLYRTLRTRQPAPLASYIRLGSATLVSSSPERFLSWTRSGTCELRPMKGTVRKSPAVPDLASAVPLLDVPKEKAENLMIVDLVRHDLHGICGSGNVEVPRLMVVEEYRSVFQMISVVQGKIPPPEEGADREYTGIDVLAASLPPGSMTGAPKMRSCEILQEIEGKERSLYSGVVGYMDVGGRGDWSVTIRSMFRWDDEDIVSYSETGEERRFETWHIGAGGAITALSTPEGEREEMQTKLNGTLGAFR
jgi:para-aminobenzoate synthetase